MPQVTLTTADIAPMAGQFDWIYYKSYLSLWLGMSDDVLHIHAGMILLIGAAAVLRRAPWDWRPWLLAAGVEAANELYDVFQTAYVTDEGNWGAAWHDFWMTLLWPTVILLTFRRLGRRGERGETPVA